MTHDCTARNSFAVHRDFAAACRSTQSSIVGATSAVGNESYWVCDFCFRVYDRFYLLMWPISIYGFISLPRALCFTRHEITSRMLIHFRFRNSAKPLIFRQRDTFSRSGILLMGKIENIFVNFRSHIINLSMVTTISRVAALHI